MESDQTTTIAEVKDVIERFVDARDWKQFHDPKNVAMALASEVGELLEHFRWVKSHEAFGVVQDATSAEAVASELADVVIFALDFATICGIDVTQAIVRKLELNERRYPVEKAKGTAVKYDRL